MEIAIPGIVEAIRDITEAGSLNFVNDDPLPRVEFLQRLLAEAERWVSQIDTRTDVLLVMRHPFSLHTVQKCLPSATLSMRGS